MALTPQASVTYRFRPSVVIPRSAWNLTSPGTVESTHAASAPTNVETNPVSRSTLRIRV